MKVSLVGAGPGDPGLLTIKGKEAIENADVIIYDALANPLLLDYASKDAELIYVGKVAGKHALPQHEINSLLSTKAREDTGKNVVRLKGGDPYIFGRGGEEAEYLYEKGIPFEEIPGITSAIAAAAYAGIPLTHRDFTSSVTIVTGHESPDKMASAHNWDSLAKSNATLIFVMGMKNLDSIVSNLISSGMNPEMPSAIVYRGTTPMQRSLFSPLKNLPAEAEKYHFTNPSIIIVGKVTRMHTALDWFSRKPLFGKKIMVTRAREQASALANRLAENGADVIEFPLIKIIPIQDYSKLDKILANISQYRWIVFTSANGVRFFWERLIKNGLDSRALHESNIAVMGPGTAEELKNHGINPDFVPDKFIAESLASGLLSKEKNNLNGIKILLPRAKQARNVLVDELEKSGAKVDVVPVYETIAPENNAQKLKFILSQNKIDCITFGSSSTVTNFANLITKQDLANYPDIKYAAIGPITAATLANNGLNTDIQPTQYTIPDLVYAITRYFSDTSIKMD